MGKTKDQFTFLRNQRHRQNTELPSCEPLRLYLKHYHMSIVIEKSPDDENISSR